MANITEAQFERIDQIGMARVQSMISKLVDAREDVRQALNEFFPIGSRALLTDGREAVVVGHTFPEYAEHGLFVKFDGEAADYPRHNLPWRQIVGPVSR